MTEETLVEVNDQELLYYVRNCFEWRNADVFAFGPHDSISRLGEIAAYIAMLHDKDGNPRADSIKVVLPPPEAFDREAMTDEFANGTRRAYHYFETDDAKTAPFVAATLAKFVIVQPADFTLASLAGVLAASDERQAVIVGAASHYRSNPNDTWDGTPRTGEDIWSLHLHSTMLEAERQARIVGCYIILDIAQYFPAGNANLALLKSVGDVGLSGISYPDDLSPEEAIAKVDESYTAAAAGDIGKAISLIENDTKLSDRRKWIMRMVMFNRAGMRDEVSRLLDASSETIADLRGVNLLGVARIANGADRDDFAHNLVERALPEILGANDLEDALRIALETRRRPLIDRVSARLRVLHPDSRLLRSVDAQASARAGEYSRAADLLEGSQEGQERSESAYFRQLADAVAGPEFADPVVLLRNLVSSMPERKSDLQREIMRALERAGRRNEAVELLFSGGVRWDERWFIFACALLGRALSSGSGVVGPDKMLLLVDAATSFIASNPGAGYARTSVSDLFDAEHVGLGGTAILLMKAVAKAELLPGAEADDQQEPNPLDDIGALPKIMERILEWLAQKGDGIVVGGRHTVPPAVLQVDPDAVLYGILRMVNYHTPEPNDPAEEIVLKHFVVVALAVAPTAADPDADIPIARGAAVKAIYGGRPQLARDLAEQILALAGERPARRRRALSAFADIYARIGRFREALLVLMAAFELPSERTWREAWDEQSVLLRILRDAGMAELAISIIERLRGSLVRVSGSDVFRSRLDTLEMHAQLRRWEIGASDAWTTTQLLDAAIANAKAVLDTGDEPLPGAVMLRQLMDKATKEGIAVDPVAQDLMEQMKTRLAGPNRTLLAAAGQITDATMVASVAGPVELARYRDDVGYDLKLARTMATRLARAATEKGDSEDFAYAIELLGVQGVGVRGANAEVKSADRMLSDPKAPLQIAIAIAQLGIPIVGLVLDRRGLMAMAMTVSREGARPPVEVDNGVFSLSHLSDWSRKFPYSYSDPTLPESDFRAATDGLGVPELPTQAIVLAGGLSALPPNVLSIGQELAGQSRSMITAPSLAWLKASIEAARNGDGSAAAWIPIAAGGSYMDTLSLLAGEISDVLDGAGIALHTQSATPGALASVDLAIVGAHGGLAEGNRFFRGLSDDQHNPADIRHFVDVLRSSRVAILFVCSGGRLDQHPESGNLVGIAHRLLDQGLEAVIAPSWPIPFTMARPWLAAFLEAWRAGSRVIEAYRAGNEAVSAATSTDLGRSLAMSLYGNPFVTR